MPHGTQTSHMTEAMEKCIADCQNCAAICLETLQHCLMMGGKHASPDHITTLVDCADICQTSASFMLRGSQLHANTCRACAAVCRACEESCRSMGDGDDTMLQCADMCRECAESCEEMARAA